MDNKRKVSPQLLNEIITALETLEWGSLEIYVQDHEVTQITEKRIKKSRSLQKKN